MVMRLSRGTGTGLDFYLDLPLFTLREMVNNYVEVLKEDAGEK